MGKLLFDYEMNPTTWVYVSSLMIIGVYFKFRRFWSVRNLDLLALITFSPGLLMVCYSSEADMAGHDAAALERMGYIWLFSVGAFFMLRLLLDLLMVRRPLLEPNLSASGLTFAGAALLVFMIANVVTAKLTVSDVQGARRMDALLDQRESPAELAALSQQPPGCPLFQVFATYSDKTFPTNETPPPREYQRAHVRHLWTGITAILAHLAVVLGMVLIGYRHFDNVHTGVAAACLYLMLPYTAQATPLVGHVVPAALLIWAIEGYRRPVLAGFLLGFAAGLIFYPLFLLPLWCSFYWRRGLVRFLVGFCLAMALLIGSLALTSGHAASFLVELRQMFNCTGLAAADQLSGFWKCHDPVFRIPVMVAFAALCGGLALWPAQKNLGTLLSCSAAVMLGAQFWHVHDGGMYMAWYLPLLLLTIFRPNLEDRVALSALGEGWFRWRKSTA
jgi:hypothetical protein